MTFWLVGWLVNFCYFVDRLVGLLIASDKLHN